MTRREDLWQKCYVHLCLALLLSHPTINFRGLGVGLLDLVFIEHVLFCFSLCIAFAWGVLYVSFATIPFVLADAYHLDSQQTAAFSMGGHPPNPSTIVLSLGVGLFRWLWANSFRSNASRSSSARFPKHLSKYKTNGRGSPIKTPERWPVFRMLRVSPFLRLPDLVSLDTHFSPPLDCTFTFGRLRSHWHLHHFPWLQKLRCRHLPSFRKFWSRSTIIK